MGERTLDRVPTALIRSEQQSRREKLERTFSDMRRTGRQWLGADHVDDHVDVVVK